MYLGRKHPMVRQPVTTRPPHVVESSNAGGSWFFCKLCTMRSTLEAGVSPDAAILPSTVGWSARESFYTLHSDCTLDPDDIPTVNESNRPPPMVTT